MTSLSDQELKANLIYSDGACSGNPGRGGWGTIVVTPDGLITELGGGETSTTNNRMELLGAIRGLEALRGASGDVLMLTDSTYVIRGITQWVWGWKRRGWKTAADQDVVNRDLWEVLLRLVGQRKDLGKISWRYVRGHKGIPGNERVDAIAVAYSKGEKPGLFRGPLLKYHVPVYDLPPAEPLPEMKQQSEKKEALAYLSLLNGTVERHATWAECERRIKGRQGAKCKKVFSEDEVAATLRGWGV